jgi:enamine deaminase RidA (YjgF/YER057c/UK114 family)
MRSKRVSSDTPWEKSFGYARAVRRGNVVAVSGTVASDDAGAPVGRDAYAQTRAILIRIARALGDSGATFADVVRLRVYYADPGIAEGVLRALAEDFPDGLPALTTVRVTGLVAPEFLLEIEADAVVAEAPRAREDEPVWEAEGD